MWNIFSSLFNPTGRLGDGEVKLCANSNLWEGTREAGRRLLPSQSSAQKEENREV